ncbi:hypothetical protein HPB52_015980 [Rhipicephalus sanguineus]|uniref:Uncharacterized protein n=1 Tax=Rhipicephalus sanguineus TaxID=34632 RepID=A0A9D4QBE7_RHISA|nr:hypothetical protein HPB52_015980 [Rhipicephalus sanguineus]
MAPPRKSNVEVGSQVVVKDHPLPARVIHIQGNQCQIQFVDDSIAVVHLSSVTKTETSVTVRSRTTRSRSSSKSPEKKRVTSRSRSRSASRAAATSSRTPRSPQKKAAAPKSPSPTKKAKSPARKSPAPKSPGRPAKTTRPKSPGRPRSPAPKSPARKSPAAKSPARKTPAKTRAPSKSPAGTATQRKKSVSPARERGGDSPRAGPSRIPVSSSSSSSSLETASQPPARSRASLSTPLGTSASQPVVNLGANSITRRVVSSPATGTAPHVYSVPGVRSSPRIATMHSTSLEEDEEVVPSTSKKSVVQFVEPKGRFQLRMPQVRLPFRLGMSLNALLWFFLMPSLALVLHLLCQKAHDDELPSADVAFDNLRAGGVLIPAEITLEGFADADKDLELCAELTDDEIIHQVTEDSDDSDTENEEPAPTQPTSSELTRALMILSLVYSGNMTLTEIEADIIAGKRTVQKKISDFFAPKC